MTTFFHIMPPPQILLDIHRFLQPGSLPTFVNWTGTISCDENTHHGQNIDRLEQSFPPMTNTQEFRHCYKIILIFHLQ